MIRWVSYAEATHMVVGYNESGGGILATARDEFTAHKHARELRSEYPDAHVVKNAPEEFTKVSNQIFDMIDSMEIWRILYD